MRTWTSPCSLDVLCHCLQATRSTSRCCSMSESNFLAISPKSTSLRPTSVGPQLKCIVASEVSEWQSPFQRVATNTNRAWSQHSAEILIQGMRFGHRYLCIVCTATLRKNCRSYCRLDCFQRLMTLEACTVHLQFGKRQCSQ